MLSTIGIEIVIYRTQKLRAAISICLNTAFRRPGY